MTTKRALQLTGVGTYDIVDVPIEPLQADEVLVQVEGVSTCPQWDMHLWQGEPMFPGMALSYPYVPGQPGHEMVGRIVDIGSGVTEFTTGQRVAAWRDSGHGMHGCYATHVTRKSDWVLAVPEDLPTFGIAPLELSMCVSTLFLDLDVHNFFPCRKVGVAGLGPSGLIAMQMAKAFGAQEVVGLDPDPNRRAYAKSLGLGTILDPTAKDALPPRSSDEALNISFECVGHHGAFEMLTEHTRDVVAIFGVQRADYVYKQSLGSHPPLRIWGYVPHHKQAARFALDLIKRKELNLEPLVTHTMALRDYDQVVALLLSKQAIKVGVLCDEASV